MRSSRYEKGKAFFRPAPRPQYQQVSTRAVQIPNAQLGTSLAFSGIGLIIGLSANLLVASVAETHDATSERAMWKMQWTYLFFTILVEILLLLVCSSIVIAYVFEAAFRHRFYDTDEARTNNITIVSFTLSLQAAALSVLATGRSFLGSAIRLAIAPGAAVLAGTLLVGLGLAITGNPGTFLKSYVGFHWFIWEPAFDTIAFLLNTARAILVFIAVPLFDIFVWLPRGFLNYVWTDSNSCLAQNFGEAVSGVGKVLTAFIEEMFSTWILQGVYNKPLTLIKTFTELQVVLLDLREILSCECEILKFIGYIAFIPFTPLPPLGELKTWGADAFLTSRQVRSIAVGSQYATPAIGPMFSNLTVMPFNLLVTMPAKAIKDRDVPDFNPFFNNMANFTLDATRVLDQSIQGALWLIEDFLKDPADAINFNASRIDYNPTIWPPLFETQSRIFVVSWMKGMQQLTQILTQIPRWDDPNAFELQILFPYAVETSIVTGSVFDITLKDAHLPMAKYSGVAVRDGLIAAAEILRFLYSVVVYSIVGITDAIAEHAPFATIVRDLNSMYYIGVTQSMLNFADSAGLLGGYAVAFEEVAITNNTFVGCFARESIRTVTYALNGTMTVGYLAFSPEPNFFTFLDDSAAILDVTFEAAFRLGICLDLTFANLGQLTTSVAAPCSVQDPARYGDLRALTLYPVGPKPNDPYTLASLFHIPPSGLPPVTDRRQECIASGSACAVLAAGEIGRMFVEQCVAEGGGIEQGVVFSDTLISMPTLTNSTSDACMEMAWAIQTKFREDCFNVYFQPQNMFCNFGFALARAYRVLVAIIRDLTYQVIKGVAVFGQKTFEQQSGSTHVSLEYPKLQATAKICDLEALEGAILAAVLGMGTDGINAFVGFVLGPATPGLDEAERRLLEDEVESAVGSLVWTGVNVINIPLTIFNDILVSIVDVGKNGLTLSEFGGSPKCEPTETTAECDKSKTHKNIVVWFVNKIMNVFWGALIGIFEAILGIVATVGGEAENNAMHGVYKFMSDMIRLLYSIRDISELVMDLLVLFAELIFEFFIMIFSGFSQGAVGLFTSTWHAIMNTFVHLAEGFARALLNFLESVPGLGKAILWFVTKGCDILQLALTDVYTALRIASFSVFHKHAPNLHCPKTPAPLTQGVVEYIPSSCTSLSPCYENSTCTQPDGTMNFCNLCHDGTATGTNYTCNTVDDQCQCGIAPNNPTPCTTVAADCAATDVCFGTGSIGGAHYTTFRCGLCGNLPAPNSSVTAIQCDTVLQVPHNPAKFCQCPLLQEPFKDYLKGFGGETCGGQPAGSTCNAQSSTGLVVALHSNLDFNTFWQSDVNFDQVQFGIPSLCEDVTAGKCAPTPNIYLPSTCICKSKHTGTSFTAAPLSNRRLLQTGNDAGLRESLESLKSAREMAFPTNFAAKDVFLSISAACDTDSDCQLSPSATCADPTNKAFKFWNCRDCVQGPHSKNSTFIASAHCDDESKTCHCGSRGSRRRSTPPPPGYDDAATFETDSVIFSTVFTGTAWDGKTWCDDIMNSLITTPRSFSFDELVANNPITLGSKHKDAVAIASVKSCLAKREKIMRFVKESGVYMPLGVLYDWPLLLTTLQQYGMAAWISFRHYIAHSEDTVDEAEALAAVFETAKIPPEIADLFYGEWDRFFKFLVDEFDLTSFFTDDPNQAPTPVNKILIKLAHKATKTAEVVGTKLLPITVSAVRKWHGAANNITNAITRYELGKKRHGNHNKNPSETQWTVPTKAVLKVIRNSPTVFVNDLLTDINQVGNRVSASGRRLLAVFGWVYDNAIDCAVVTAVFETAVTAGDTLGTYYSKNLPESIIAWQTFNPTKGRQVMPKSTSPDAPSDLEYFFAIPQFKEAKNWITHVTTVQLMNQLDFFIKCDIKRVVTCPINRGLVRKGWFAILLFVFASIFVIRAFPMQGIFLTLLWTGLLIPWILFVTYDYSPFCFPAIPPCLIDDIVDGIVPAFRPASNITDTPISHAFTTYIVNNLTDTKCTAPPYNFNSVFAHASFIISSTNNQSNPLTTDNYWVWQKIIPRYDEMQLQAPDFRACNFLMLPYNAGIALFIIGAGPLIVLLLMSILQLIVSLAILLSISVSTVASIYQHSGISRETYSTHEDEEVELT